MILISQYKILKNIFLIKKHIVSYYQTHRIVIDVLFYLIFLKFTNF